MQARFHCILIFSILFLSYSSFGQDSLSTVIAKNGDGIFSMLRKSGIHPVKYYAEFLDLNEDLIRNGSELIVGKTYTLPNAPDSFKNMGTKILVDTKNERPIFDAELAKMKLRDSSLQHTVYYLMYSKSLADLASSERAINFTMSLAKDLLVRGARVYILESEALETSGEKEEDKSLVKYQLGEYTSVINKKYLKHNGSYQRLLVMQDKNGGDNDVVISVHHYDESKEGKRLAGTLQDIFRKNAIKRVSDTDGISTFNDDLSIYLAKNVLPSVTTIDLDKHTETKGIRIKKSKSVLKEMITDGILEDYSKLNFQD